MNGREGMVWAAVVITLAVVYVLGMVTIFLLGAQR